MENITVALWQHGHWLAISLYIAMVVVHFAAEPLRWNVLFYSNKFYYRDWFSIFGFTAFMSYLLPAKMGFPLRIYFLRTRAGLDYKAMSLGLLIDAVTYYGFWVIAGTIGASLLIIEFHITTPRWDNISWIISLCVLVIIITLVLARCISKNLTRGWISKQILSLSVAIKKISFGQFAWLLLIVGGDITSQLIRHICLVWAFGITTIPMDILVAIAAVSIMTGLLTFTPMGLGGYDATIIGMLIHFGVSPDTAAAIAVTNRLGTLGVSVILGIISGYTLGLNPFNLAYYKKLWKDQKLS